MFPGNVRLWYASPFVSWASATVGTACWFVQWTSSRLLLARLMMPLAATAPAMTTAIIPSSTSLRRPGILICSEDICLSSHSGLRRRGCRRHRRLGLFVVAGVHDAEQCRHEEQGCAGGEQQAADHRTTERRVLAGLDGDRKSVV